MQSKENFNLDFTPSFVEITTERDCAEILIHAQARKRSIKCHRKGPPDLSRRPFGPFWVPREEQRRQVHVASFLSPDAPM